MDDPLYPRALLRLAADARGAGRLDPADASASVHNPACGDRVTVTLRLERDRVADLAHDTQACLLAQAAAALLAGQAAGQTPAGIAALADRIRAMLAQGMPPPPGFGIFEGAAAHPGRHVCVLLPFEAALKALEGAYPGGVRPQRQGSAG
jgi:NifU-like protein involved in Fe-S cluster formation